MQISTTDRGFQVLRHQTYPPGKEQDDCLAQQSSIIGDYNDACDHPGTSLLWIGSSFHLSREEVALFVRHLQAWLETGSFMVDFPPDGLPASGNEPERVYKWRTLVPPPGWLNSIADHLETSRRLAELFNEPDKARLIEVEQAGARDLAADIEAAERLCTREREEITIEESE
jgi:hypothetical protein